MFTFGRRAQLLGLVAVGLDDGDVDIDASQLTRECSPMTFPP